MNFQSNQSLHLRLGLVKALFHRADDLVSKPDDRLSEHEHLRQSLNFCCYNNSTIDHAISFNKCHNTKTATSILKDKHYVALPYYGELSDTMKLICKDYDTSPQFTAVKMLKNSLVHPKDKQQQSRQGNFVYEICSNPNFAYQDVYIGETSPPLQHRLKQHCRSSYNGNDSAVFKHINASGHQIDVNDVVILDRDENWF